MHSLVKHVYQTSSLLLTDNASAAARLSLAAPHAPPLTTASLALTTTNYNTDTVNPSPMNSAQPGSSLYQSVQH